MRGILVVIEGIWRKGDTLCIEIFFWFGLLKKKIRHDKSGIYFLVRVCLEVKIVLFAVVFVFGGFSTDCSHVIFGVGVCCFLIKILFILVKEKKGA